MFLCTDVHYNNNNNSARAACVAFDSWETSEANSEYTVDLTGIAEYVPGHFFQRELPCLLAVLEKIPHTPNLIIVDGYVWLGQENHPGLGQFLFDALHSKIPVIGVAKNRFKQTPPSTELLRGNSKKPLYVTSAGIELVKARTCIANMHGEFRIPTLLKRVDQLCRNISDHIAL